jgi:hypothetical protein
VITDNVLKQTNTTMIDSIADRDVFIDEQNEKITHLGRDFDKMLNDMISRMTVKLEQLNTKAESGEGEMSGLSEQSLKLLNDFKLNRPQCD